MGDDLPESEAWKQAALEELMRVFHDRDAAVSLTRKAGFPLKMLPEFRTPNLFWERVATDAENGALTGGVQRIITEAAKFYPDNSFFGTLRKNGERRTFRQEIAERLEFAYQRREDLMVADIDTEAIDKEILELRRQQRQGPTLHEGEFLDHGRFRLIEVVGYGGFATVWKAYDRRTRDHVAIKVLHGQFAQDTSRRERLFRGARRMAELQHTNVARVIVPEGKDHGFYYYTMEFFEQGDLYQAILNKKVNVYQALDILESIAGALELAHKKGLVHRDVKPHNILLRKDGTPAIADFDLVHAKDTTGGTRTGALGTVIYAAPEQNEDASVVDHRADIYSLGMTAVFCIYGRKLPSQIMYRQDSFLTNLARGETAYNLLRATVALDPAERMDSAAAFCVVLANIRKLLRQRELRRLQKAERQARKLASESYKYFEIQATEVWGPEQKLPQEEQLQVREVDGLVWLERGTRSKDEQIRLKTKINISKKKTKSSWLLIMGSVLGVGLGVAGFFVWRNQNQAGVKVPQVEASAQRSADNQQAPILKPENPMPKQNFDFRNGRRSDDSAHMAQIKSTENIADHVDSLPATVSITVSTPKLDGEIIDASGMVVGRTNEAFRLPESTNMVRLMVQVPGYTEKPLEMVPNQAQILYPKLTRKSPKTKTSPPKHKTMPSDGDSDPLADCIRDPVDPNRCRYDIDKDSVLSVDGRMHP